MRPLRKIDSQFPPVTDNKVTLILVTAGGEVGFAADVNHKRALLKKHDPNTSLLMAVWTGVYRSDVFHVSVFTFNEWVVELANTRTVNG